jgi:membrane protease YdiL (CAAX protease family)
VTTHVRTSWVVLALCVLAFCIAMGLRAQVNIWIGTGVAASVSLVLLRWAPIGGARDMWNATRRTVLVGLGAGLLMSLATWALYPLSTELIPEIETEVTKLYALLRQTPGPVAAFPLLVLVVIAEERVWRGLALDLFGQGQPGLRAVTLSALVYTFPQIALRSPLLVAVALACGLVWGGLRVQTRGLAAPLIAHLLWDLLVFVLFPVA